MRNLAQFAAQSAAQSVTEESPRRGILRLLVGALVLLAMATPVLGQALPAAEASPISTGFSLPHTAGTLNYAVSASESLTWGYFASHGVYSATNLNGDVGYLSGSKIYPFSMVFAGGYSWANSGEPSYGFLNFDLSQVINLKRWNIVVSDSVGYLPATPTAGLSGIPGVGDLGVQVGPYVAQGILTNYSDRVTNSATGSIQRQVTGKTSLSAFGSYSILRFLDGGSEGLDDNSSTDGGTISHQVNARNSFGGTYSYSIFTYPGFSGANGQLQPNFTIQTVSGQFMRKLTKKLTLNASVGPQWTRLNSINNSSQLGVYAMGSAAYQGEFSQITAYYDRSTNAGYGVIAGAFSQGGGVAVSKTIARVWNFSSSGSYTKTTELPVKNLPAYTFDTTVASIQTSRAIVRSVSIYASYTFEHQSNAGAGAVDVFGGNVQVVGFGVTYAPPSIHVGRQ